MIGPDMVEIDVNDIQPGDYIHYYSLGKPSGHVTRRVISKLRNGPQYVLTVETGTKGKTEAVYSSKVRNAYRDKVTQEKIVVTRAKEQDFHKGLMTQLNSSWKKP